MMITNARERTRFLRFVVVGGIGFIVDFSTFNLLATILSVPAVLASALSFTAAVSSNFIWNRYWTYPDSRTKRVSRQMVQFGLVSVTGLLIRTPVFAIAAPFMRNVFDGLPYMGVLTPRMLGDNGALAVSVVIVMFWNFFINRYWTYSDVD